MKLQQDRKSKIIKSTGELNINIRLLQQGISFDKLRVLPGY